VAAVLLVIFALEESSEKPRKKLLTLSSFLFLLAGWTRPEAVIIAAVVMIYIGIIWWKKISNGNPFKAILSFTLPYGLFLVFWAGTSRWIYNGGVKDQGMFQEFIRQALQGNFYLLKISVIFSKFVYYLFNVPNWGALGFGLSLLAILFIINNRLFKKLPLLGIGAVYLLMVFGVYYSTLFVDGPSLAWWLSTGLTRLIMPGVITLWVLMVYYAFPVLLSKGEGNH
jgi:hypothetical protein